MHYSVRYHESRGGGEFSVADENGNILVYITPGTTVRRGHFITTRLSIICASNREFASFSGKRNFPKAWRLLRKCLE